MSGLNSALDFGGKFAFVSCASRGIGEAIAKLLAQQGAHVIVSSRKLDGCRHVADVNVRGYFFMSVEAGKLMCENGGGHQHDQSVRQGMCAVRDSL
ncbi:NAD(P)-dependent dehydrogenase (short-subunit alcohol dehydrogenase family) [Pseudomonas synxantha]|uniref:NAD(P)-dependent dehydrogenase (Short-subunit alcohol dehydrogenase family) n=1 Tax=Pseudomonas synxantha TaxID=47883 RepID=A0ACC6JLW7_9PSED|nr:NAD(P)-dependent dehydrogenase (short-subunit alcohol dehydrogenase family) [Pseudomonas synxantha]